MGESNKRDLTPSQKKFVEEWIYDFNGTRAYQVAYPNCSIDSARSSAATLLANPNIREYAQYLQDNLSETAGISRLKVLREHEKLAFSSIAHLHNTWIERKEFDKLTDEQKACIAEIQTQTRVEMKYDPIAESEEPIQVDFVKVKLYDKQKALDSISKMLGFDAPKKININTSEKQVMKIGGQEIEF